MKRRVRLLAATILLISTAVCPSSSAFDKNDLEYDIFRRDSVLTVWLDLSFYLSEINLNKLAEGIDLALEYDLTLAVPKRFWGENTVARNTEVMKISYHRITENYILTSSADPPGTDRRFIALDKLLGYLSDSVFVPLAPFGSLDARRKYTLETKITGIALTAINLLSEDEPDRDNRSALKSLFKSFLNLTGYGRKEFSVKSRAFSLDEIYPGP